MQLARDRGDPTVACVQPFLQKIEEEIRDSRRGLKLFSVPRSRHVEYFIFHSFMKTTTSLCLNGFLSCLSELIEGKAKLYLLYCCWLLNGGSKINRRTLIGTAKRWPRRDLIGGGRLLNSSGNTIAEILRICANVSLLKVFEMCGKKTEKEPP